MTFLDPTASYPGSVLADTSVGVQTNREQNQLAADLSQTALSLTLLNDVTGLPARGVITIDDERILYVAKDNTTRILTIASGGRGFDGSSAAAHLANTVTYCNHIANHYNRLLREIQATQTELGATGSQKFVRMDGANSGTINVLSYGAVGDGVTDDSVASSNAINAGVTSGKTILYPAGYTFVVDTKTITAPVNIFIEPDCTLRLKNNATESSSNKAFFIVTSSNVSINCLGWLDANRDGQDRVTYNTAGGATVKSWVGVLAKGTSVTPISNLLFRLQVKNSPDFALSCSYVTDSVVYLRTDSCGAGSNLNNCSRIYYPDAIFKNTDNVDWKILPHVFDVVACSNIHVDTLSSTGQSGDDNVSGGTSLSDWISGVTFHGSTDIGVDYAYLDTVNDNTANKSVGVSLLSCERLSMGTIEVNGYTDVSLELGGVKDSWVANIILDGRYQSSNSGLSAAYRGFAIYHNGYYPDFVSRSVSTCERLAIGSIVVKRFLGTGGVINSCKDIAINSLRVYGCRTGLLSQYAEINSDGNWTPQPVQSLKRITIEYLDLSYNEINGLDIRDAEDLNIGILRLNNNGQALNYPSGARLDSVVPSTTQGLTTSAGNGSLAKTGWSLEQVEARDDQTWTQTVSSNSVSSTTISASNPSLIYVGQTIKLTGAGAAGADLFVRVNDRDHDEVTISDPIVTFPTVSGTGTVGVSGTTLTGSGTIFLTELLGRYWITVSGQKFQIAKIVSNTSAVVTASASPTIAPGASFTIEKITAVAVQSQQTGVLLHSSVISPDIVSTRTTGNTVAGLTDNTAAATPAAFYPHPRVRIVATADAPQGMSLIGSYATNNQTPRLIFWNSVEGGSTGFSVYKSLTKLLLAYGASPGVASGSTFASFDSAGTLDLVTGSLKFNGTTLFDNNRHITTDLVPDTTATRSIGSSSVVFLNTFSQQFTVKNQGAGANPSFTSNSGIQTLDLNAVLLRATDITCNLGNSGQRWLGVYSSVFYVHLASGDTFPSLQIDNNIIRMGAGGASATDITLARQASSVVELAGSLAGSVRYGMSGTATPFLALRAAAADAQPLATILTDRIAFGPGGASAVDFSITRTGVASADLTGTIIPATDNTYDLGSQTRRFAHFWTEIARVQADANAAEGIALIGDYAGGNSPRIFFWNKQTGGATGFAIYNSASSLVFTISANPGSASGTSAWLLNSAGSFSPAADATYSMGSSNNRIQNINARNVFIYGTSGDANPAVKLDSTGVLFGAGGGTATDILVARQAQGVIEHTSSALAGSVRLGMSGAALPFVSLRLAAADANAVVSLTSTGINFGPGGATVIDSSLLRQAASVLEHTGSLAGSVRHGMSGASIPFISGRLAAADANSVWHLGSDVGLSFGAGGASARDVFIERTVPTSNKLVHVGSASAGTTGVWVDTTTPGIILKDAAGTPHFWRVTVSTSGVLTTTDLGTALP